MKIPNDKLLHLAISAALTIMLSFLLSWIAACFIVFGIVLAKELADRYLFNGQFSIDDLYADGAGILIGTVLFAVLGKLIGI
jgi:hypothetical protein